MKPAAGRAVLITGVAGFIGSNLADRLLAEGYRVRGVDDLSSGVLAQVPSGVDFHELDVRSARLEKLLAGVETVFHLAAKNCISDCQADPLATASINVLGSANVFESARRAGVRKLVFAETSAVYEGTSVFPTPETEDRPESVYAVSKAAARRFAETYGRFHGIDITTLRYFCVYGPRQDYRRTIPPVMSAFVLTLLGGRRPVIYGSGEKRRDFVYVDDVNDFHVRCLEDRRTDGGIYNLGSGRSYSVLEVLDAVQRLLGTQVEPEHRPDLPGEAWQTHADIGAARALGWEPRTGLEEGLHRSIEYIRENVPQAPQAAPGAAAPDGRPGAKGD